MVFAMIFYESIDKIVETSFILGRSNKIPLNLTGPLKPALTLAHAKKP